MTQLGKLSPELLETVVFPFRGSSRDEVLLGAGLGRDCGVMRLGKELLAVTCDPITGVSEFLGFFAVQVVMNDLVCSGAEPLAVLVSLLFPPETPLEVMRKTMQEIDLACRELDVAVLGGHTEVSRAVRKPLVHCVGLGRIADPDFPDVSRIVPGDVILMTKGAGIEGTAILAWERGEELIPKLGKDVVEKARAFLAMMSVVKEARAVIPCRPHCLHDVTEGGLIGALWEVCASRNLGFAVEEERVFVFPETAVLARHFGIDPLRLISSGTLLIFTSSPQEVIVSLQQFSVPVFEIGRVTEDSQKLVRRKNGDIVEVKECPQDELWKIVERS